MKFLLCAAGLLLTVLPAFPQATITPPLTEGPYYKSGSPERSTLYEPGDTGRRIVVTGKVLDSRGTPVAGAWVDVWQADAEGRYDNAGYRYRGHFFTGADGTYAFRTVVPGEYPGRTQHIHVKVRAPSGPVLTTQLFFPEASARNVADSIFDRRLLVRWDPDGTTARFDFVLP
jgi:protocatechuate 3,4-dioxygenase beta subunit